MDSKFTFEMNKEQIERILKLLNDIDSLARDSRGCYENARGNDMECYEATEQIRKILNGTIN